jgi:perosamine synthetase
MAMRHIKLAEWKANRKQKRYLRQVIRSGRLTYGPKTRKLEEKFAEIHGAKHALFVSSGTDAIKISLAALKEENGWADGSEVIIPAVTFVATMNAVLMNNLTPVLVDIEQDTANIDPLLIEKVITKKTVAIMPVHLLGQMADIRTVVNIAKKHKLKVITDSCETMFVNSHMGDITCFSTYMAHLLVTGVGGFILTNETKMAFLMRSIMFHGRDASYLNIDDKPTDISKRFYFPRHGFSDRATEMEAAVGLGGLDGWESMIEKRQQNAFYLSQKLVRQPLEFPVTSFFRHAFMFFPMYVAERDKLMAHLESKGIECRTMVPLLSQPITKPFIRHKYPNAETADKHGILLPCHQYLSRKDLDYMIKVVKEYYA